MTFTAIALSTLAPQRLKIDITFCQPENAASKIAVEDCTELLLRNGYIQILTAVRRSGKISW
jgi:hypothetical protein